MMTSVAELCAKHGERLAALEGKVNALLVAQGLVTIFGAWLTIKGGI